MKDKNTTENYGVKVGVIAIIWTFATGMMAICIPLVSISRSGIILPLFVILGVCTTTISIWRSGNQKVIASSNDVQEIEQRVRDLETIISSDINNSKLDKTNK